MPGVWDEAARLRAVAMYAPDGAPAEPALDAVVRAAALVAGVETALIGIIDADRQWYIAKVGTDSREVARSHSFCDRVLRGDEEIVVADATQDRRFADHPDVLAAGGIRLYGGFPLRVDAGQVLGTLCVVGYEPGELRADQLMVLRMLADQVVTQLELRRTVADHAAQGRFLSTILETVDVGIVACDAEGRLTHLNRAAQEMHGRSADGELGPGDWATTYDLYDEEGIAVLETEDIPLVEALRNGEVRGRYMTIRRAGVAARVVRCDGRRFVGPGGEVRGAVVAMADVTEQRAVAREMALLVNTDPLTGALNRRGLYERVQPLIAAAIDEGRSMAVAVIDFDHFKEVNDRLGHAGGDDLLRRSVASWRRRLREDDLVARLGGEEFAVVLVDCWPTSALGVVDVLRSSTVGNETASAGVAFIRPGDDLESVLDRADRALYRAKREGRDRTIVADIPDARYGVPIDLHSTAGLRRRRHSSGTDGVRRRRFELREVDGA